MLRALKKVNDAKVLIGESAVTAAPFFESAGRPNMPFWGEHVGPKCTKMVLCESLQDEEKEACLEVLKSESNWVVWCRGKPNKQNQGKQICQRSRTNAFSVADAGEKRTGVGRNRQEESM